MCINEKYLKADVPKMINFFIVNVEDDENNVNDMQEIIILNVNILIEIEKLKNGNEIKKKS